jgi:hypothetical protein
VPQPRSADAGRLVPWNLQVSERALLQMTPCLHYTQRVDTFCNCQVGIVHSCRHSTMLWELAAYLHSCKEMIRLGSCFRAWARVSAEEKLLLKAWAAWWHRRVHRCMQAWQEHAQSCRQQRCSVMRIESARLRRTLKVLPCHLM